MIAVAGAKRLLQEARDSWREAALPVVADSTIGTLGLSCLRRQAVRGLRQAQSAAAPAAQQTAHMGESRGDSEPRRRRGGAERRRGGLRDFTRAVLPDRQIKGQVWNPDLYKCGTKGDMMRLRLMAAFDAGVRREEMMLIQLKHIDFKAIVIRVDGEEKQVLAIEVQSKGEKTTGKKEVVYIGTERLKQALQKRRFALCRDPDAYVFGTEDGRRQKDFRRMWRELFMLVQAGWSRLGPRQGPRLAHAAPRVLLEDGGEHGRSGRRAGACAAQGSTYYPRIPTPAAFPCADGCRQAEPELAAVRARMSRDHLCWTGSEATVVLCRIALVQIDRRMGSGSPQPPAEVPAIIIKGARHRDAAL